MRVIWSNFVKKLLYKWLEFKIFGLVNELVENDADLVYDWLKFILYFFFLFDTDDAVQFTSCEVLSNFTCQQYCNLFHFLS